MTEKSKSEQMKSTGATADTKSNTNIDGTTNCPPGTDWIEVGLFADDETPMKNIKCIITDTHGKEYTCKTDTKGLVKITEIPKGECTVNFSDLDQGAWELETEKGENNG